MTQTYSAGTVTVVQGRNMVYGVGTAWTQLIPAGLIFSVAGQSAGWQIDEIVNDTTLCLALPYGNASGAGLAYVITNYLGVPAIGFETDWTDGAGVVPGGGTITIVAPTSGATRIALTVQNQSSAYPVTVQRTGLNASDPTGPTTLITTKLSPGASMVLGPNDFVPQGSILVNGQPGEGIAVSDLWN